LRVEKGLVYVTAEEMREIDRSAVEEFGIGTQLLMENAGRAAAELARRLLGDDVSGKEVVCLAGKGNNGGDALVAARYLHNWGARVDVLLATKRDDARELPAMQLAILERMKVPVVAQSNLPGKPEMVVDGLLGYNAVGNPRGEIAKLIRWTNDVKAQTIAMDVPSGLNATTGEPGDPTVLARATLTLGFPKTGFLNRSSRPYVGELYLADLSLPPVIYERFSQTGSIFARDTIVRIPSSYP